MKLGSIISKSKHKSDTLQSEALKDQPTTETKHQEEDEEKNVLDEETRKLELKRREVANKKKDKARERYHKRKQQKESIYNKG